MRDLQRNKEEERTEENEQNPTYFSSSLTTEEASLHKLLFGANFYIPLTRIHLKFYYPSKAENQRK